MLTQEELDNARARLAAGRIIAVELQPYLSSALLAMTPVPTKGLGTFAVDKRWRMYYDPAMCLVWTPKEIAAVWLHECNHVLRKHGERFDSFAEEHRGFAKEWNYASDAAINSDLKDEKIFLPDPDIRFYADSKDAYSTWRKGMTAEELFTIAIKGQGKSQDRQVGGTSQEDEENDTSEEQSSQEDNAEAEAESADTESNEESEDTSESDASSSQENQEPSDDNSETEDTSSTSDTSQEPNEGKEAKEDSETDDSSSSSSGSSNEESSEKEESDSSSQSSESSDQESDSTASDDSETEGEGADPSSPPQGHTCGSGAVGGKEEYEVDDEDDGSLNEYQAQEVRRETAKAILEESSSRGTVPGGLLREAQSILTPQTDWRRELPAVVRKKTASSMGKFDYSYSKPSRRNSSSDFFMPSLRSPEPPSIAIIIDTSGSVSEQQLSRVLAEIMSIIKRNRSGSSRGKVYAITCDVAAHVKEVKTVNDIELIGGGGTDMRVGFEAADEIHPTPDIVLCITDGYTPFPKKLYPKAEKNRSMYIVGIVPPKGRKKAFDMTNIPEFIKGVYMSNF